MKTRILITSLISMICLASLTLAACAPTNLSAKSDDSALVWLDGPSQTREINVGDYSAQISKVAQVLTAFSSKMNAAVPADTVFSPFSFYLALASLRPGLTGTNLEKLDAVLKPADMTAEEFQQTLAAIQQMGRANLAYAQPSDGSAAQAIWQTNTVAIAAQNLTFQPSYLDALAQMGMLGAQANFRSYAAYQGINKWVSEQTKQLIDPFFTEDKIAELQKSNLTLILLNTLYFKNAWKDEFPESASQPGKFQGDKGTTKVTLMNLTQALDYLETDTYQAVRLPYQDQGQLTLVLPKDKNTSPQAAAQMLAEAQAKPNWERALVQLSLPRWSQSSDLSLKDVLPQLGLEFLTDSLGESKFFSESIDQAVSDILQRVEFKTNEKGTEAAAATAIMIERTAAPAMDKLKEVTLKVDRAFVYNLTAEDLILFQGSVRDLPAE